MFTVRIKALGRFGPLRGLPGLIRSCFPGGPSLSLIGADIVIDGSISSRGDIMLLGKVGGSIVCRQLYLGDEAEVGGLISAVEESLKANSRLRKRNGYDIN